MMTIAQGDENFWAATRVIFFCIFFNSNLITLQQLFDKSHLNFSQKRAGSVLSAIENERK